MAATSVRLIPGMQLGSISEGTTYGCGTLVRNGRVYSCLTGRLNKSQFADGKTTVQVMSDGEESVLPMIGNNVIARVTKVNARYCKCLILAVDNNILSEPFHGTIRREDVRATQKDKVELHRSFRPCDIVLAKVISLGDAMSYFLTTAENELGVIIATSEAGHQMVAISWCEMQCPRTMRKEFRKVAKVQADFLKYLSDP